MAERGFLDHNDMISYPLVDGDPRSFVEGGSLPTRGLTDARFLLGANSGFAPGTHAVRLHAFSFSAGTLSFDFRSDCPGMADRRFLFSFDENSEFGTVVRANASMIDSPYLEDRDAGDGAIVLGDLSDLKKLPGARTTIGVLRTEPALIQSMHGLFATSIGLANQRRPRPASCGDVPVPVSETRCAYVRGLVGALKFREGYNAVIGVLSAAKTIKLDVGVGAGAGSPCRDIIIDEISSSSSSSGSPDCSFEEDDGPFCDGYVKSINGLTTEDGKFALEGGQGVVVENDPDNHRIIATTLDAERICGYGSSSSS